MSTFSRPGGFQVLPPIVKNLVIINVIFALGQMALGARGIDLADYLGLHYWRSSLFQPWQLVTHLFMHGSAYSWNATLIHLFSNMFALWMFGSMLENIWGAKKFLTFYFVCGIGAALCHLAVLGYGFHNLDTEVQAFMSNPTVDQFDTMLKRNDWLGDPRLPGLNNLDMVWQSDPGNDSYRGIAVKSINNVLYGGMDMQAGQRFEGLYDQATVGASGAVFGILFAFGYLSPNMLLYFYFLFPIKAKWFVFFYAGFELYAGVRGSASDNVAHFAHLGGMLFAFMLLRFWKSRPPRFS